MVIELSCVNEAGIAMTPSCINPHKRALSGSDIPPVDSSESYLIATMFIHIHHNTFYVSLVGRAPINRWNWNDNSVTLGENS
jgi:hypothetical protein